MDKLIWNTVSHLNESTQTENKPPLVTDKKPTKPEALRNRQMEIANELLRIYEEDIESGIEDGTYKASENVETRAFIAEAKQVFAEFEKFQPSIYICIEGNNVQGASANCYIDLNIYDDQKTDEENGTTAKEWEEQIKTLTESNEIRPIP
jgi:hypothetical protein